MHVLPTCACVSDATENAAVSASFASDKLPIEQPPKSYSIRSG